jgi:hypothetical protein
MLIDLHLHNVPQYHGNINTYHLKTYCEALKPEYLLDGFLVPSGYVMAKADINCPKDPQEMPKCNT